jgi:PIN domain-containing protein
MAINPEALYCFLDTDVLLHFTTFDEVNWLKFLNTHLVYLVLPITVVRELEKHKDDGSKPHLQERARMLLPKIFKFLAGTIGSVFIREGVFLLTIPREPLVNWKELELDQDVKDNRILARMILFKQQYPDVDVCLLTNDYASVLNATDRNIRAIMPDGQELVQIELKSSIEAKLHATQKELNELKNRLPKLEFGFYNGQELNSVITCSSTSSSLHTEVLTKALTDDYTPQQVAHQRTQFDHIVSISKGRASDDQIKQFTKEYDEYLEEFEPALKRKLMSDHGQKCYLAFVIKNTGTAPVTDFRLDLHFPPGTLVIDADDEKKELKIPKEPKPSWMADPPSAFVKGNLGLNLGNLNLGLPRGVSVLPDDTL